MMAASSVGDSLVKAYLTIMAPAPGLSVGTMASAGASAAANGSNSNARLAAGGPGTMTFKFNPKEYALSRSSNIARSPQPNAKSVGGGQNTGSNPRTLTVDIFMDETDSTSGDVSHDVDILMGCCTAFDDSKAKALPVVLFGWGKNVTFKAIVKQVDATFTLFRSDGTPIRATCKLRLEEQYDPNPDKPENPTSGTRKVHRTRKLVAGDTLQSIAYDEYRQPKYWRGLAEANGIDDPLRVPAGTTVLVPPASDVAALS